MAAERLRGGIAVFTNWTYSLFYVFSELWETSFYLCFLGLANETVVADPRDYIPLAWHRSEREFVCSGFMMNGSLEVEISSRGCQARFLMSVVLTWWVRTLIRRTSRERMVVESSEEEEEEKDTTAMDEEEKKVYDVFDDADVDEASEEDDSITEVAQIEIPLIEDLQKSKDEDSMDLVRVCSKRTLTCGDDGNAPPTRAQMAKRNRSKKKRGLLDALKFVANSPELSCLAVMAISQGISTISTSSHGKHS